MLGMTSQFDADEHTRIGGEIGAYIRRLAEKSHRDLEVIRYNKLGVFCIIEYLSPNRDVFVDTMNLGASLANFDRRKSDELQQRLFAPLTCAQTSTAVAEGESDYLHMRQECNDEEHERQERLARGE